MQCRKLKPLYRSGLAAETLGNESGAANHQG